MPKPELSEAPEYYHSYIRLVEQNDLVQGLIMNGNETVDILKSIPERSGDYRYAEGKWSIKELLAHVIDSERVFAYRALSFSRKDQSELPGYEQDDWVVETNASHRKLYKMIDEFNNVRASMIDLFSSMTKEMLKRGGKANGNFMSVNAIGFIILGHEIHHRTILADRYFS